MTQAVKEKVEPVKFSIQKDVSEVYRIRLDSYRCAWANITISSQGEFSAITDCGNFSYRWPVSDGENFKESLIRICHRGEREGYLYDKIHDRDKASRVDAEKTVVQLKKELFQYYREKKRSYSFMAEDKAKIYPQLDTRMRDAYDELESIASEGYLSADAFYSLLWNSSYLGEVFDGDYIAQAMDVETVGDRGAMAFCEVVAPILAQILVSEREGTADV